MPQGRKSGGAQKGGGFGKSLTSRRSRDVGGLDYQKPDINRLRNERDSVKATSVMDFVSVEKKDVSVLEAKDLDEFFTQSLMQKRTFEENRSLVIIGRDGAQVSTDAQLVSVPRPRNVEDRVHYKKYPLPKRPFHFEQPHQRVLHFARTYVGLKRQRANMTLATNEGHKLVEDDNAGDGTQGHAARQTWAQSHDTEDELSEDETANEMETEEDASDETTTEMESKEAASDEDEGASVLTADESWKEISSEDLLLEILHGVECSSREFEEALFCHFGQMENFAPFLSVSDLEEEETAAFSKWRKELGEMEKNGDVVTPYEKNLSYWRQLWRTIERSDLVLEIVDARNPLLFRSEALEDLVRESAGKEAMLIVNKTDYLSVEQRNLWRQYFDERNLKVVFYSALKELQANETKTLKLKTPALLTYASVSKINDFTSNQLETIESDTAPQERQFTDDSASSDEMDINAMTRLQDARRDHKRPDTACASPEETGYLSLESETDWSGVLTCHELQTTLEKIGMDLLERRAAETETAIKLYDHFERLFGNLEASSIYRRLHRHVQKKLYPERTDFKETKIPKAIFALLFGPRRSLARPVVSALRTDREITVLADEIGEETARPVIGTVGFPNVGKSSLINSLMKGLKRVAVSRTPGKTKHLQTLNIPNSILTLCDCPVHSGFHDNTIIGLVMPTSGGSKEELVINSIMNADTYRGSLCAPIGSLLRRVGDQVCEIYGLHDAFALLRETTGKDIWETPREAICLLARARGFYAGGKGGLEDVERMCRILIKVYTMGKYISYCEVSPNAHNDQWQHQENLKWEKRRQTWRRSRAW